MFAPKVAKTPTKAADNPRRSRAPQQSTLAGRRLGHDPVEQALFLQRTIGNQATLRLLAQQTSRPAVRDPRGDYQQGGATENTMTGETSRGASWDFSKIPLFPPNWASRGSYPQPSIIQQKLVFGQPNDPLEHEADRVADEVMHMRDPAPTSEKRIQRQPARHRAPSQQPLDPAPHISRVGAVSDAGAGATPEVVNEAIGSPGHPLDAPARTFFEPRFGCDLSDVRIHADDKAAGSARTLGALAYTVGPHIFFGSGEYQPSSPAGRHLIAHELTHSIQQSGLPPTPAIAQRQTPSRQTQRPAPSSCDQTIRAMTTEALRWLDDAHTQLLNYEVDEVFALPGAPPAPDHQRITGSLRESFQTNDTGYVSVIRQRLLHVANMLQQPGAVTFTCGGPHCSASGGSFTAAYVERPYAVTMCGMGTGAPPDSVRTFIHEMIHAVVPQVGIRNRVTPGTEVIDRAYLQERVFRFLSPDEALDNAESYALLTDQLFHRRTSSGVSAPTDTTTGCKDPNLVLEAFARADQWNRSAHVWVQAVVAHLRSKRLSGVSDLAAVDAAPFTRLLPSLTSVADLAALEGAYESLQSHGFSNPWDFGCVSGSPGCSGGALAFSDEGSASATSITPRRITTRNTVGICPNFLTASLEDRIRSIYAAFLIGRPSWIIAGFRLADKFPYVNFARDIANRRAPPPAVTGALTHELANAPPLPAPTGRPKYHPAKARVRTAQ
jgi:hypothetical protein